MIETTTSVPNPDPTVLTTQGLLREISLLEQRAMQEIETVRQVTTLQFELVERQRVEQKKDTKDAVDAALTAQKEAVKEQTTASERAIAKSEAATTKQSDQLSQTFNSSIDSVRRSIEDVKERVAEVDRKASAIEQQKLGANADRTALYAVIGVLSSVVLVGLAVIAFIMTHYKP